MMLPRLSKFDVLDDMFDEPLFTKRESQIMKTDIKELLDKMLDADDTAPVEIVNMSLTKNTLRLVTKKSLESMLLT